MQTQQKHFKAWRAFWGEVLTMWRKEHGLTLANCFKASFPIALLSLAILIVSVIKNSGSWRLGSGIALGISGFIAFFNFCFIFPFKKYTLDTEVLKTHLLELKDLEELRNKQRSNPTDFIHPILTNIEGLDKPIVDIIYVNLTFINQLLEELNLTRMTGKIVARDIEQPFEFTWNSPYNFHRLLTTSTANPIRQQVILSEPLIKKINEIRVEKTQPFASGHKFIKLIITMERQGKDPIILNPSDIEPVNLKWRLNDDTR